jgi:hypothetical protein
MGAVQERAIEAVLLGHVHRVRPYGGALATRHRTAWCGRIRLDGRAESDLVRHGPRGGDLDAGDAALGNGCSDGHRVLADSDQGKKAGSRTLDGLLHVLAEVAHLRLWLTDGEIVGAGACVHCCVSHADGGGVLRCHQDMQRVRGNCRRMSLRQRLS